MSIRLLLFLALFQALASAQTCDQPLNTCDDAIERFPEDKRISIKYATKTITKLAYFPNFVDMDVTVDTITTNYRFVVCGCKVEQTSARRIVFINPLSFYIEDGPSLALYDFLAENNTVAIKALQNRDSIFNSDIRSLISTGSAVEVGLPDGTIDYAKIAEVDPALSIVSAFGFKGYDAANIDVPFLVNGESQEDSPLARAEWLKVFGLVLDQAEKANEEFTQIEKRYNDTKETAEKAIRRPAVFFNAPFLTDADTSDLNKRYTWTLPVTDEYIVQLVRDANADYRYIDEKPVAGETGNMFNISTVVREFTSADILIQSSQFPASDNRTLEEYLSFFENPKDPDDLGKKEIEKLKAVRCATVWNHQKRVTADGNADDFFESAIVRPDELLADIVQALHPYLDFEDRETVFLYRYEETANTGGKCPNAALVKGTVPEGEELVDTKFEVPGLDRYQIADRLERSIIPEIEKRVDEPFEVFFHHEDVSEDVTLVTVRVQVNSTEKDTFVEGPNMFFGMRESLGEGVRQRNEDGSTRDPPDEGSDPGKPTEDGDGGGLSGGGIAGIVIAVIVVVLVLGFFIVKRRSRSQMPVPMDGAGGFDQDITV